MSTVRYDVADHVATVALDRPEQRNALSDELLDDLLAALERARADEDVRCVVLTSTHEKVFSAGGAPPREGGGCPGGAGGGRRGGGEPLALKHFAPDRFVPLFKLLGELG